MVYSLTAQDFKQKIFNYELHKEWVFAGEKPAIIDFYADWCGPCKMFAPVLEELSNEYADKLDAYKVNTETEQELAAAFGVQSIPSILFIPMGEQPQMATGALPKSQLKKALKDILSIE